MEGACQLLFQYSNGDPVLPISELGLPTNDTSGHGPHDLLSQGLLPFRWENQAVCVWAVRLDGSDDPPVVVDYDSQFKEWTECASTFSQHLFAWLWDYSKVLFRDLGIQAQNEPLSSDALRFLEQSFETGPKTYGWPGHTQHRFTSGRQRLLIWAGATQADWWLTGDDEDELVQLAAKVYGCDDVGQEMWSHGDAGNTALARVRSAM